MLSLTLSPNTSGTGTGTGTGGRISRGTLPLALPLTLALPLQPMVRWASCPPGGWFSEGEWSLRGLEAHATRGGGFL
jgi:hypothetical protein